MDEQLTNISESEQNKEKKNPVKSNLGMIVFFLILALFVAFFAGFLPIAPIAVATGSMEPTINVGDVVLVCHTDTQKLKAGDIIQYKTENYTVIHRIVECSENGEGVSEFITQGDANNAPDSDPVTPEQIDGRVILRIPNIGKFTLWLYSLNSSRLFI